MIKDIEITPNKPYYFSHYFCDYIELIALISNDIVSTSDIYERFKINESLDGNNEASDIYESLGSNNKASEIDDKWTNRIKEWFDILAVRESIFNDFYPFAITGENSNHIQLKNDLNNHHKLYLFLLLSSSLKYIQDNSSLLTSDFEALSLEALKNYLPNNAQSHIFGTTSTKYTGTLKQKVDLLAEDLKYKTKYDEGDLNSRNTGDGGVDLVAWIPFEKDDNQNNMQVFLAQCAAGKDWAKKQYEPDKFTSKLIDFKTYVNKAIFIPYDVRKNNRDFSEQIDISNVLFFDRVRVVYLLINSIEEIMQLESFNIVQNFIEYEESLV